MTFNASDDPVVAVVEKLGSGTPASLRTISVDRGYRVVETPIADNLNAPRNAAIAVGQPLGEIAIYVGTDSASPAHGTGSEVFFRKSTMVERAPLPQHPNIPGPLAFDQKGRLHHVYLVSTGAGGGRAIRSLVHRWREPSGEWRDEIAVSVHAGPMNAHIGLALIPNGQPVVLAERGLPFDEVADLDWNTAFIVKNERRDYGEDRYRVLGKIGNRLYAVVFTPREDEIRVISFRRANRREEVLYDRAREQERGR